MSERENRLPSAEEPSLPPTENGEKSPLPPLEKGEDTVTLPIKSEEVIPLDERDLEELKEWEIAETKLQAAPDAKSERPTRAESPEGRKKEKRPLTPEERAAKERRDIEDVIYELGLIRDKDVSKIELFLALRDGIGWSEVRRILGSPEKVRTLPEEKRKALALKISELTTVKMLRSPEFMETTNMRVPELSDNPAEYHRKLRDEARKDKFKRLQPFFDNLDKDRYALEEFFDVRISIE